MMGVTLLVIECQSRIDMFDGIGQCTPSPTHRPRGMVRLEHHLRAIQFACDSEEIVRNLFRSVEAAIGVMEQPRFAMDGASSCELSSRRPTSVARSTTSPTSTAAQP